MSLGALLGLLLREEPESRQPSLVQRSRATVLELWASPDLPSSPWTYPVIPWHPRDDQRERQKRTRRVRILK